MSTYRAVVLEHFRAPRNCGPLPEANASAEGVNHLCGDRIRVQLRFDGDVVTEARFTADACALCIASASLLTERARGVRRDEVNVIDTAWLYDALGGEPPTARRKCALLALDTLQRAASGAALT